MLKFIVGFVTGTVVGAVAYRFISKEAMANDLKNETEQIRAYYKKKFAPVKKDEAPEEAKEEETQKEKAEMYRSYSSLSSLYNGSEEKEDIPYDKYSKEEKEAPDDKKSDEPYCITKEQYDAETLYERKELIYYEPNTLLTDYEDVVIDIDSSIGFECLKEDNIVDGYTYARNDILKEVYEVKINTGSFLDYYEE